jgi:hypothetical protein
MGPLCPIRPLTGSSAIDVTDLLHRQQKIACWRMAAQLPGREVKAEASVVLRFAVQADMEALGRFDLEPGER